jgi:hypothetical protein
MSEQELFEMLDRWADAKGVLRLKKRKEEEPPFALPVDDQIISRKDFDEVLNQPFALPVGYLGEDVLEANRRLKESIEATASSGELWGDKLMDDLSKKVQQENAQSMNTPARAKLLDEILSPPAAGKQSGGARAYARSEEACQLSDEDVEKMQAAAQKMKEAREAAGEKFDTVYRVIDGKLRRTNIPKRLDSLSKEEILAGLKAEADAGHKLGVGMTSMPRILPPQGGSGTARPVPMQAKPSLDGPFGKWLHQLWSNPAENWSGILLNLTMEQLNANNTWWENAWEGMAKAQRHQHADEMQKVREEMEKSCRKSTRKAVSAALTNLTRESFEEIQTVLKYAHSLGKTLEPDFVRAKLGLDPATGEYVSRPPKTDSGE